ncbi:MAG: phytase [Bryobacteraceae bacterium]
MGVWLLLLTLWMATQGKIEVKPVLATEPVSDDPDDPAVWVNPRDPAQSLIVATN